MAEKVFVKKYSNRRLYDTEQSAYVSLSDVAAIIKKGREVEVVDVETKEDVTAFILTQIILEEARKKNVLLPSPLLHLVIQHGEHALSEFFETYLQQVIQTYLTYKSTVDVQFKKWLGLGMNLSELTQKTLTGLMPFPPFAAKGTGGPKKKEERKQK
jgi:polyhydroxyalkanoate synthesis repressor PhaR